MAELGAPFRYRVAPRVLALRWQPDDLTAAPRMVTWLDQHRIGWQLGGGLGNKALLLIIVDGSSEVAEPGDWVVLVSANAVCVLTDAEFCDTFDPEEA